MPGDDARVLDVRTSRIDDRIAAIDDFVEAGYEVHLNLSPAVLRTGWEEDWGRLLDRLDDEVGAVTKAQAAAEVILLTHNEALHEVNLGWHPTAEGLLWRPDLQEPKRSQNARTTCGTAPTWSAPPSPGCGPSSPGVRRGWTSGTPSEPRVNVTNCLQFVRAA